MPESLADSLVSAAAGLERSLTNRRAPGGFVSLDHPPPITHLSQMPFGPSEAGGSGRRIFPTRRGRTRGREMNERIIKVAHMVAVGLMLLAGVAAVTR